MDILHILGSICSIVGLAFAAYVYIKSKNKKKWFYNKCWGQA